MDTKDMLGWLNDHLAGLDWSGGVTKDQLVTAVEDDEALRNVIGQYVTEGRYASLDEVLAVIPVQAWQDAQGDTWRGGDSYDADSAPTGFRDGPVGRDDAGTRAGAAASQVSDPPGGSTISDQAQSAARSAIDAIGRPAGGAVASSVSQSPPATGTGRTTPEDAPLPSPGTPTLPDPAAAVSPREAGVAPEAEMNHPEGGSVGGDALAALREAGVSPATLPRPSDLEGLASAAVGATEGSSDAGGGRAHTTPERDAAGRFTASSGAGTGSGNDREARRSPEAATGSPDFTSTGERGFTASRQANRATVMSQPTGRPGSDQGHGSGPSTPLTGQAVLGGGSTGGSTPPPPLGGSSQAPPAVGAAADAMDTGMTAPATGTETASGDPGTAHAMDSTDAGMSADATSGTAPDAAGDESDAESSGGITSRAAGAVGAARSTLAAGTEAARSTLGSVTSGGDSAKDLITAGTEGAKEKIAAGVEAVRSNPVTGAVTGPDPTGEIARATKGAFAALPARYAALGLSLLNEGAGQYYNGQRGKAAAFAIAGLALSSASGMSTWLPRDIVGPPGFRIGPRHPRPLLVAVWGALYTYGLWDAWSNAPEQRPATGADPSGTPAAPEAGEQAGA